MQTLTENAFDQLFRQARTYNDFSGRWATGPCTSSTTC